MGLRINQRNKGEEIFDVEVSNRNIVIRWKCVTFRLIKCFISRVNFQLVNKSKKNKGDKYKSVEISIET